MVARSHNYIKWPTTHDDDDDHHLLHHDLSVYFESIE